ADDDPGDAGDGQAADDGWPSGSRPVAVVAPIDVRPVEPPSMDEQARDASTFDTDRGETASAPHVEPAAE
ncbi:MAG TPA: hypothetical protein VGC42_08180, partial [Kofleriaceae bacterium]